MADRNITHCLRTAYWEYGRRSLILKLLSKALRNDGAMFIFLNADCAHTI